MDFKNRGMFNSEGYKDTTPYLALQRGSHMNNWKDGDIFKLARPDGQDMVRVILRMNRDYALTVNLYPRPQRENDYCLTIGGEEMHCDLGRLSYTTVKDLEYADYQQSLQEEVQDDLIHHVAGAMGCSNVKYEDVQEWMQKLEETKIRNDALVREVERLRDILQRTEDNLFELQQAQRAGAQDAANISGIAEAERNIYKEICHKLIDRIGMPQLATWTTEAGSSPQTEIGGFPVTLLKNE